MVSNVIKDLFKQAGIQGNFTNHSLKRSARTILANDGFGRDTVIKKNGHLSNSDIDYLEMSRKMEIKMSDSLNFCHQSSSTSAKNDTGNSSNPTAVIEKGGAKLSIFL